VAKIDFYEIVEVLISSRAAELGVQGSRGIVVGVDDGDEESYAILIGSRTFMLGETDLTRTGERVNRETIYDGESIQVHPEHHPNAEP
jgi:hypothetical protein